MCSQNTHTCTRAHSFAMGCTTYAENEMPSEKRAKNSRKSRRMEKSSPRRWPRNVLQNWTISDLFGRCRHHLGCRRRNGFRIAWIITRGKGGGLRSRRDVWGSGCIRSGRIMPRGMRTLWSIRLARWENEKEMEDRIDFPMTCVLFGTIGRWSSFLHIFMKSWMLLDSSGRREEIPGSLGMRDLKCWWECYQSTIIESLPIHTCHSCGMMTTLFSRTFLSFCFNLVRYHLSIVLDGLWQNALALWCTASGHRAGWYKVGRISIVPMGGEPA